MAGMYGCFKVRNDSAAMASGSPDVATNQEPAEVQEDCSGKKKSKFQTFKKLFARKKRKEPQSAGAEEGLKGSQSSDNVSKTSESNTLTRSEKEKGSGSRISLGNKALSHDSVFVSDSSEANEGLDASQDSIHGKVKSLQLQLKQAIRLGSPPSLMCVKKTEDGGATSEDDGLPCSPPDYTPLHSVKSKAERSSSNSLHGVDSDERLSIRAVSPPAVPGDFSQPASPFVCLDNSAAKHKLGLRNKACNRRKPGRRLQLKTEGDSAVEEEEQQRAEVESRDQLKAETEQEEDEEDKPQKDSPAIPLADDEGEGDAETEEDVSHAPDASCPLESSLSEERHEEEEDEEEQGASVDGGAPSSSSTSSSLDSPSVSPEPPAGQTEHLTGPAGFSCAVHSESDSSSGEEANVEEGSSLLEEVLSSLKTSHSPDVELSGVVMETEDEAVEVEERKEEADPAGVEGPASSPDTSDRIAQEEEEALPQSLQEEEEALPQSLQEEEEALPQSLQEEEEALPQSLQEEEEALPQSLQEEEEALPQSLQEEEEALPQSLQEEEEALPQSLQEEEVAVEEEAAKTIEEELEEDNISERFIQQTEEEEEVESEEEIKQTIKQEDAEEEWDSGEEEEEEEVELKEEPEAVEEKCENEVEGREEGSSVEVEEMTDEEEAEEEAKGDEEKTTEGIPDAEDEEEPTAWSFQEEGEGDDATPEMDGQIVPKVNEEQQVFNNDPGAEEEEEEEEDLQDRESEDVERSPDRNQSGEDVELGKDETSPFLEEKEAEAEEEGRVSSRLPLLFLPESRSVSCSDQSPTSSPSKTSTLHIHLASPTSEKPSSPLRLAAETEPLSPTEEPAEFDVTERREGVKNPEEEEKQSAPEQDDSSTQEAPSTPTDQSKARFTVAPAWQRLQSHPASPTEAPALRDSRAEAEEAARKERDVKAEPGSPAEAELAPSPVRGRSSGSFTSKPQSYAASTPAEAHTGAAGRTPESAAVAEANPDGPFGVRLRKTSALLRFGSEEVESEPQVESPTHPLSAKAESPQPVSSKPPTSHPISNKPALPKKPEIHGDAGTKPRRISEPAVARSAPDGSHPPTWISVAKQKQKVYKETPLNEITVQKEEQEGKPPSPPSREQSSSKPPEPTSRVSVEKETRRTLSVPTPVPPQPPKTPLQKPPAPPTPAKPSPRPDSPRSSPSKPPPVPSKTPPVALPRTVPEKAAPRQAAPPTTLPQDEPPWMALAKKKAKAWSEMPQIVQ
ncbi:capping protein-inhibiting regulator of actin dynamics isoform X2 [Poeciliopsis prolifica]|uniref:capping protein-inhibiting regulator of actin dynamics isoform X2 n=1 Tax=Poeciliopsis prolifica TaxID=188132 RepID=UPI002413577A|nr:capping protein-inhibiting regulator of actin dynamics isoform X2 [Poeciliopsis prolifica]